MHVAAVLGGGPGGVNSLIVGIMANRRALVAAVLVLGCGPTEPLVAPGALPSIAGGPPADVVVCPEGSAYDAARKVCVAVQTIAEPAPEPPPAEPPPVQVADSASGIRVSCAFANGWVSLLPAAKYPKDDQFLMQALIGLTEEPKFWLAEKEYAPLSPFAAKKCGSAPVKFDVKAGSYFILAGEAGTFAKTGVYARNGFKKKVQFDPASPITMSLKAGDLTHTWLCISCPWVAFFDPAAGGWQSSFVVLKDRRAKSLRGTDRIAVASVVVLDGRVKLRVVEAEHEVTHLDALTLEIAGKTVLPSPGSRSALAGDDGIEVEMSRGHTIELTFDVPGVPDGTVPAAVVATGYYDPTAD